VLICVELDTNVGLLTTLLYSTYDAVVDTEEEIAQLDVPSNVPANDPLNDPVFIWVELDTVPVGNPDGDV
jgi:hypothetical protein